MDTDVYIHDLDFDLPAYLVDKADKRGHRGATDALGDRRRRVHAEPRPPFGREIVRKWQNRFAAIDDAELAEMTDWPEHFNDQSMLYGVLGLNAHLRDSVHYESGSVINSPMHGSSARF